MMKVIEKNGDVEIREFSWKGMAPRYKVKVGKKYVGKTKDGGYTSLEAARYVFKQHVKGL